MEFVEALASAAAEAGLTLGAAVAAGCHRHYELLVRWNAVHNLTRITDPVEAARKHYVDCLAGLAALEPAPRVVDAGAGAGFPGVLAALAWAQSEVVLVEPSRKRVSFLELVCRELGLRCSVVPGRIEDVAPAPLLLSRATFPWSELRILGKHGRIAAWVGHEPSAAEWAARASSWGWTEARRIELRVPGADARAVVVAVPRGT